MSKIKLGVIFGGISTEHDVSIVSGTSVIQNLNKEKYEITPIYISKDGTWYTYEKSVHEIKVLPIEEKITEIKPIDNLEKILKGFDVIFPVLHGLGGEDGSIQGMFKLFQIPYVGCGVLASSVGMDKVYTKILFDRAGIHQANYEYIKKQKEGYTYIDKEMNEMDISLEEICVIAEKNLSYPMFVKPSNSGSSVGISKVTNKEELKKYNSDDIYVIGGESVYEQLLPYCDTAHITLIDYEYEADAHIHDFASDPEWVVTADSDEITYFDLSYSFVRYERVKKA